MIAVPLLALLASPGPCSVGSEFMPPLCPTGLPPVASVRITAQGVTRWQETNLPPDCPRFHLNEAQAKRFFRHARRAEARDVHYTLSESPCVVRGNIVFSDGSRGNWQIDSLAVGWLDRPRHPRLTLYCRSCRSAPWMQ